MITCLCITLLTCWYLCKIIQEIIEVQNTQTLGITLILKMTYKPPRRLLGFHCQWADCIIFNFSLDQMDLTQGQCTPLLPHPHPPGTQRTFLSVSDIFGCHNLGVATGIWAEGRDTDKHFTMYRTAPTTKNCLTQNVNSAKAEKLFRTTFNIELP